MNARDELANYLALAAPSRADLLGLLCRETPAAPCPEGSPLPELPEDLPLLQFLAMERRTAVDRLRRLTDDELSRVFYPTQWTDHPEELWTARKALRRLIEHEREHTAQVREILAARRGTRDHRTPAR